VSDSKLQTQKQIRTVYSDWSRENHLLPPVPCNHKNNKQKENHILISLTLIASAFPSLLFALPLLTVHIHAFSIMSVGEQDLTVSDGVDGLIHLVTSRNHYMFNLAWLRAFPPPPPTMPLHQ
jgi:hypothetical protein